MLGERRKKFFLALAVVTILISQVPQLTEVSWVYNTLKTVKFCEVATDFVDSSGGLHKIGGALM